MAKKQKRFEKEIPSVFSLFRGIEISDAEMDGVVVFEHGGVTIKSHLSENEKKNNKIDKDKIVNLYYGEVAKTINDEIKVKFTFKPNKFSKRLSQANDVDYYKEFHEKLNDNERVKEALKKNSEYIAFNLMNGRWLWRNKMIAESVKIVITNEKENEKIIIENALDIDNDIMLNENNEIVNNIERNNLKKLAEWIYNGFQTGNNVLKIEAILKVEKYINAYPSELFVPKKKKITSQMDFGKEYYKTPDTNKPALTAEKVWNAIRTYDVWYPEYDEIKEPISIEFKGGSLKFQDAFRNSKSDFRFVLNKFMNDMDLNDEEMLYFVGCLIRGGIIADEKEK